MKRSVVCQLVASFGVAILMSACASPAPDTRTAAAVPANPVTPQQGVLVMSMAHTPAGNGASAEFGFRFRPVGSREQRAFSWRPKDFYRGDRIDFDEDGVRGAVFVRVLAPGDYEWVNFDAGLQGLTTFSAKDAPRVPFRVVAGQLTYLGEILFDAWRRRNLWGQNQQAGFYVVIRDRAARDLETARRKQPELRTFPVSAQVPNPRTLGHSLYRGDLMSPEALKALATEKTPQ